MLAAHTPQEITHWFEKDLAREKPELFKSYCERYGLTAIPAPRYITADMAEFYSLEGRPGEKKWVPIKWSGLPHGLVTALEKGWLTAPPAKLGLKRLEDGHSEVATSKRALTGGVSQRDK